MVNAYVASVAAYFLTMYVALRFYFLLPGNHTDSAAYVADYWHNMTAMEFDSDV
jgi:hypothetical protein